jgi:outer membrane biogenesis lipoprotein LolB
MKTHAVEKIDEENENDEVDPYEQKGQNWQMKYATMRDNNDQSRSISSHLSNDTNTVEDDNKLK